MGGSRVFISHSSDDADTAERLVAELESRDLPCWVAPRDIPPGADYSESIISGISDSRAMVVLVSKSSIASTHVRSEVARAASDGTVIYPVRLVDIEIAGGLQFFLELSQWVDFFPNPTAESYDALANAIKSGKRMDGSAVRRKFDPRRWVIGSMVGAVLIVAAILGGLWGFSAWQDAQMIAQFEEERLQFEAEQAQRDAERAEADLARIDVVPNFYEDVDGVYLSSIYATGYRGRGDDIRFEYSINNGNWIAFEQTTPSVAVRLDIDSFETIVFRVIEKADNSVLKEIDKTDALAAVLSRGQSQLEQTVAALGEDSSTVCTLSGCQMRYNRVPFCSPTVTSVEFRKDGTAYRVADAFCERPDISTDFCVPAQDLPFALRPGETLEMAFGLRNGGELVVERPILDRLRVSWAPSYADVPAQPGQDGAPALVANYTPPSVTGGQFTFVTAWGACNARGLTVSSDATDRLKLLVDVDGLGFMEMRETNAFFALFRPGDPVGGTDNRFPIALPAGPRTIRIAFGDDTGIKHGPWAYDFDPADVVAQTVLPDGAPVVACSGDQRLPRLAVGITRRATLCMPLERAAFFDVDRVEFGGEPGAFSETVEVDFSAKDFISMSCDYNRRTCPPFLFEVPDEWSNIYSRVVLKDGTTLQPRRHTLQR